MDPLQRDLLALKEKMDALTANADVRALLASVAQNPQDETFMIAASQATVSRQIDSMTDSALRLREVSRLFSDVLIPLQYLFCSSLPKDTLLAERYKETMYKWLFENLTRLKKWLIVAKVLAYKNLASFKNADGSNVVPTPCDTPSQIMELWILADKFERHVQPECRRIYMNKVANDVDRAFLALGYGADTTTPNEEALKFIARYGSK